MLPNMFLIFKHVCGKSDINAHGVEETRFLFNLNVINNFPTPVVGVLPTVNPGRIDLHVDRLTCSISQDLALNGTRCKPFVKELPLNITFVINCVNQLKPLKCM